MRKLLSLLIAFSLPAIVVAGECKPDPTELQVQALGLLGVSGEADTAVTYGFALGGDFPFGCTGARGFARLELTTLPGAADPDRTIRPEDFTRAGSVDLGSYLRLGGNLSVYGQFSFRTRMEDDPNPDRYPQALHAGFRFSGPRGFLRLGIGDDDAAGAANEIGSPFDQLFVAGYANLGSDALISVGAEAVLNMRRPRGQEVGRNYMMVKAAVNLPELVDRRKK